MIGIAEGDLQTITSLIQLSIAPVFLIAGIAGLLGIFTGRLARIIDRLEEIDKHINGHIEIFCVLEDAYLNKRRNFLIKRMTNINLAILASTATGLMVALVVISVFYSALMSVNGEVFIAVSFIFAMVFLIISLILFLREIYFTSQYIKLKKETTSG